VSLCPGFCSWKLPRCITRAAYTDRLTPQTERAQEFACLTLRNLNLDDRKWNRRIPDKDVHLSNRTVVHRFCSLNVLPKARSCGQAVRCAAEGDGLSEIPAARQSWLTQRVEGQQISVELTPQRQTLEFPAECVSWPAINLMCGNRFASDRRFLYLR